MDWCRRFFYNAIYVGYVLWIFFALASPAGAQEAAERGEQRAEASAEAPAAELRPGPDELVVRSVTQSKEGPWYRLRGGAVLETLELLFQADEVDFNEETQEAEARGNVYFHHLKDRQELWAERGEYDLRNQRGRFFGVRGSTPAPVETRQGILVSNNPLVFEGKWAERVGEKYVLYDGTFTNCKVPRPWWTLSGKRVEIVPGDRAVATQVVFRLRRVPLLYSPFFYKSIKRLPRRSGLLTPNLGSSNRWGLVFGVGYYWAINRSYDLTYRPQILTQRGISHNVEFRGAPREGTYVNYTLFGVNDRGYSRGGSPLRKEGGYSMMLDAASEVGKGWVARADVNTLSSFRFRQAFTQSFSEAVFTEVSSVATVAKSWGSQTFTGILNRTENFQSVEDDDSVLIRRMPSVEFAVRERRLWEKIPVWVSLESSADLLHRRQPLFRTKQFVERVDFEPRVMTAWHWKNWHVVPSFSLLEGTYGQGRGAGGIESRRVWRRGQEMAVEVIAPSLEKTFERMRLLRTKAKHVIEPRVGFRRVRGIDNFHDLVRFDELELRSNTTELELSLTNRIIGKVDGVARELLSWQLLHKRYFDPDFGGALREEDVGWRNVVRSATEVTAFAFLDQRRRYSPVASVVRANPRYWLGVEWRTDYDPLRSKLVNGTLSADARVKKFLVSLGHNHVRSVPLEQVGRNRYRGLSASANQVRALVALGNENRQGWNAAFTTVYDFRTSRMQFATTQVTYNTDCCGFSVQVRRFNFGARQENQIRVALAIANIGSFGTIRRQERIF